MFVSFNCWDILLENKTKIWMNEIILCCLLDFVYSPEGKNTKALYISFPLLTDGSYFVSRKWKELYSQRRFTCSLRKAKGNRKISLILRMLYRGTFAKPISSFFMTITQRLNFWEDIKTNQCSSSKKRKKWKDIFLMYKTPIDMPYVCEQ